MFQGASVVPNAAERSVKIRTELTIIFNNEKSLVILSNLSYHMFWFWHDNSVMIAANLARVTKATLYGK
jgi:hypothetical protein